MPDQVVVFLEGRVVVGRQHLAVGVDIDAGALGLLQQFLQVLQVVAADEDAGVGAHADVDLGDLRVAVGGGVGLVQQGHGLDGHLARLQHQGDHLVDREVPGGGGQGLHDEVVDLVLLVPQYGGMVGVGRDALQPDDQASSRRERTSSFAGGQDYPRTSPSSAKAAASPRMPGGRIGQRLGEILPVLLLVGGQETLPQLVASHQGLPGCEEMKRSSSQLALVMVVNSAGDEEATSERSRTPSSLSCLPVDGDALEHVDAAGPAGWRFPPACRRRP